MELIKRYFFRLAAWSVGLFALLFLSSLGGGAETPWSVGARAPALATFAMILACFPAGLSVGADVLRSPGTFLRDGTRLTLTSVTLIAVAFMLVQYVGPSALAAGRSDAAERIELREMTLPALRDYGRGVVAAAERGPDSNLSAWHAANAFAFEHERRLAHASLPFFLTWVGALAGYWARRIRNRQIRLAQLLLMAAFILVSMYMGGENGYELVAARMAGPAYFAAWFIVFVPAALGLGLGWPTMVSVFTDPEAGD
jgi:hypothetical protein